MTLSSLKYIYNREHVLHVLFILHPISTMVVRKDSLLFYLMSDELHFSKHLTYNSHNYERRSQIRSKM
jgi:hypothetical protein